MTRSEQEIVLSKCADEDTWSCYASDPIWIRKLTHFAQRYNLTVQNMQGGIRVSIPKKCITLRNIVSKRILSDEERQVIRERFMKKPSLTEEVIVE